MITIKLLCNCGQKYTFDAEPVHGRMTQTVRCPSCGADGTAAANQIIADSLPPPPSVRTYAAAAAAHDERLRQAAQKKTRRFVWLLAGGTVLLLVAGGLVAAKFIGRVNREAGLPAQLREALVLHFSFAAPPAGGDVVDFSGHGNTGRATGVQWVAAGHRGGAAQFGLTDSYISVTNNDLLNPPRLTLAAWIKTSYKDHIWRRIMDKGTGQGYVLSMCGDWRDRSFRGQVDVEPGKTSAISGIPVADGQWHHVAGTFDGADAHVYVDGWPVGQPGRWVGDLRPTPYDLTIGADRSNPSSGEKNQSFNGLMDDVMLFKRALSTAEIQMLFKAQGGVLAPQPPAPPPPAGSAAARLQELKDLFDQGKMDQPAYERRKADILKSL